MLAFFGGHLYHFIIILILDYAFERNVTDITCQEQDIRCIKL